MRVFEPDDEMLGAEALVDRRDTILKTFLPSQPIRTHELLRGREGPLKRTLETLEIPGRSVFIFGERGVGKTSLAQTSAYMFNTSAGEPVLTSCHPDVSFNKLITQITRKLLCLPVVHGKRRAVTEVKVGTSMAGLLHRIETESDFVPSSIDANEAVDLLNEVTRGIDGNNLVVVIDELDVAPAQFRTNLAYFIKQLGDQECAVKFIFAGIGETAEDLLERHESASRYLATIKLDRLPIDVLQQVIVNGFERIQSPVPDSVSMRVAYISDGFAHFTHLMGLKIALRMLEAEPPRREVLLSDFDQGVLSAVEDSEAWLKNAYDKAVKKYADIYEPVLWSVADHWELERSTEHMYPAYVEICKKLQRQPDNRHQYSTVLNRLKQEAHGCVLRSTRRSWYKFRQSMLRGYCKLQAAAHGVDVGMGYLQRAPANTRG
jgi:Cdc6-like AAA superfamily ATPase